MPYKGVVKSEGFTHACRPVTLSRVSLKCHPAKLSPRLLRGAVGPAIRSELWS